MNQPLANILLKHNKQGSSIPLNYVTPAEMMLLCAMHRRNAGGDPIVKFEEVPEGVFEKKIEKLEAEIAEIENSIGLIEDDNSVTITVKEGNIKALQKKIEMKQSTLQDYKNIDLIRTLSPGQEFQRLGLKYSAITLKEFYPGRIPTLPTTFDQARTEGVQADVVEAKWIVGNNKFANA